MGLLATRADMEQLCVFDIQRVTWKAVREKLRALPDHDHTVNWDDGSQFPWWVWLANKGALRDVVNAGVRGVELLVAQGLIYVLVRSMGGNSGWGVTRRGKWLSRRRHGSTILEDTSTKSKLFVCFLPNAAVLFSLHQLLAPVTAAFDTVHASLRRRSSACCCEKQCDGQ